MEEQRSQMIQERSSLEGGRAENFLLLGVHMLNSRVNILNT